MGERKKMLAEEVTRRSAADFFHDNKAIAGFDNPMRAVFTSVRELIENGLDAAEKRGKSPRIICTIERLEPNEVAKLLGVGRVEEPPSSSEYLRLSVKDNGTGVPHDHIPLLFLSHDLRGFLATKVDTVKIDSHHAV